MSRYNAKWRDGKAEEVVCLRQPNENWRREHNYCNPPWELLDDLMVVKLRQSGEGATVIAPYWPKKPVHPLLKNSHRISGHAPPTTTSSLHRGSWGEWGRAFRMERRGVQITTPLLMLLKNQQLHEGAHLPPIARPFQKATATTTTTATTTIATAPVAPRGTSSSEQLRQNHG